MIELLMFDPKHSEVSYHTPTLTTPRQSWLWEIKCFLWWAQIRMCWKDTTAESEIEFHSTFFWG